MFFDELNLLHYMFQEVQVSSPSMFLIFSKFKEFH